MKRRALIAAVLSGLCFSGGVRAAGVVDVVKIVSFHCGYSYSSEALDDAIASVVQENGGRYVVAPVPDFQQDPKYTKELVYYAARGINPDLGARVRTSLYKAVQENGVNISSLAEANAWLQGDLTTTDKAQLKSIVAAAQGPEAEQALLRAIRLALNAGTAALPSYLLLQNGKVIAMYDRTMQGLQSPGAIKEAITKKINELNK